MNPPTRPRAGRRGRQKADILNISNCRKKDNTHESPLVFYERLLLCRLMVSGNPVRYRYFIDPRNRAIYNHLAYLQGQEYMPDTDSLTRYLRECGMLHRAGGEGYVRSVFQGAIPLKRECHGHST
jgi:hypothetical protein